jgi:hypothetical protein
MYDSVVLMVILIILFLSLAALNQNLIGVHRQLEKLNKYFENLSQNDKK